MTMSTPRKATEAEMRSLATDGTLADNSTFDGATYRVVPQSAPAKASTTTTATKKAATTKAASGRTSGTATAAASEGTPPPDDRIDTTATATTNAHAARGPQ